MREKAILIADDVELNRTILANTFEGEYKILQAENGLQILQQLELNGNRIQAILLDLVMPEMDGFEVLEWLGKENWLDKVPVFLITAENKKDVLSKAYQMGVVDVINKPFVPQLIRKRIENTLELFTARERLKNVVEMQEEALKQQALQIKQQTERMHQINSSIIETLATLIEFRDSKSGEHIKRIRAVTIILLEQLAKQYPEYDILPQEIPLIGEAAVMHDAGKITIPDSILNKPAKLTADEYEIMKLHTVRGCEILNRVPQIHDTGLYQYCYDICRHHHERWDGRGYPDGLKGDDIPIWAQVVSVADVYDALISARVYKPAFDRNTVLTMICEGQCGTFNPRLLKCLKECEPIIYEKCYHKSEDI